MNNNTEIIDERTTNNDEIKYALLQKEITELKQNMNILIFFQVALVILTLVSC